jgi:hypothetical protein
MKYHVIHIYDVMNSFLFLKNCITQRLFMYCRWIDIQLSREEGWDPVNRFNPATIVFLSQARACGLFVFTESR